MGGGGSVFEDLKTYTFQDVPVSIGNVNIIKGGVS